MNSSINETIDTLNELTEVLKDGQHGFQTAARDVKAPELAQVFQRYATQRAQLVAELQAHVSNLGAAVERTGSPIGALHRAWINLKAALATNEPHAVLAEAERGEDAAVEAFKKALANDELDAATRDLINRQYSLVQSAHDHVRDLRDSDEYRAKRA